MEIFGGFMVMLGVLGFFLTVVWLVFPFVVFAMKGQLDRVCRQLDRIEERLAAMEGRPASTDPPADAAAAGEPSQKPTP
jgi:hypothetical protein